MDHDDERLRGPRDRLAKYGLDWVVDLLGELHNATAARCIEEETRRGTPVRFHLVLVTPTAHDEDGFVAVAGSNGTKSVLLPAIDRVIGDLRWRDEGQN